MKTKPPQPVHIEGMHRGEELSLHGKEPGRGEDGQHHGYRSARDATGINAADRQPIDPTMPDIPPP